MDYGGPRPLVLTTGMPRWTGEMSRNGTQVASGKSCATRLLPAEQIEQEILVHELTAHLTPERSSTWKCADYSCEDVER